MKVLTLKEKLHNSQVITFFIALLILMAVIIFGQQFIKAILDFTSLSKDSKNVLKGILVSAAVISSYIIFFKRYEKRPVTEFTANTQNFAWGIVIGFILQAIIVLIMYFNHSYTIISINPITVVLIPFITMITVAVIEEILVRGLIFRMLEKNFGTYLSLSFSSLLFGILHLINPHVSFLSFLCITAAGFMLGSAFIYRRNLWFPISIHFAWNFTQSGIFGAVTSGNEKISGLINAKIQGAIVITGGEFGPEGSIQATVVCILTSALFLFLSHRKNKIIKRSKKKAKTNHHD